MLAISPNGSSERIAGPKIALAGWSSAPPPSAMRRNVAILVFDGVEVLDFAGPFVGFAVTNELH